MADFPPFEAFFAAVNGGRQPFPWQARLADEVAAAGWPQSIGVPTGMGKTSCIDIAVWSLARDAALSSAAHRKVPTRTWYVVNRRLLVDAGYEHGTRLARILAEPTSLREDGAAATNDGLEAVEAVAQALRSIEVLGLEQGPLYVARLRGGAEIGERPPDPGQPALIFATVPMFASRLLFRGYGSSRSMHPVDAGLAGVDSLVLLDEAHLARPLQRLCEAAERCDLGDPGELLPPGRARARLVALTATGERDGDRFDLDEDDRRHPVIMQRLAAAKPTDLVQSTKKEIGDDLARLAGELLVTRPGSACVVFCNTVATARTVWNRLQREHRDSAADVVLLTGRLREREAKKTREEVMDPQKGAPAGRETEVRRPRDLFVVATQTLEVGADLDFDFLVTETASARALTQRFGRLNRLGVRPHARAAICHPSDMLTQPPYGAEPAAVWTRLAAVPYGSLDLSPARIGAAVGDPADIPPRSAEMLAEHLWEFAKTSAPEPDEPPVELFFEGFEPGSAHVSVCWRAHLPPDGVRLEPTVRQEESIEVPIWELTAALESWTDVRRLDPDKSSLETVPVGAVRPGDEVVLPARAGLYDKSGWNPEANELVLDVSLLRRGLLWLDSEALGCLVPQAGAPLVALVGELASGDVEPDAKAGRVGELDALLREATPHPWLDPNEWTAFVDRLRGQPVIWDNRDLSPHILGRGPVTTTPSPEVRADAFEELSFFSEKSSPLADHMGNVGEVAARIGRALALPEKIVRSLERAGRYHDIGKEDPRFQRWLDPGGITEPGVALAKSSTPRNLIDAARVSSGWPYRGRHELLSARLMSRWLEDRAPTELDDQLVLHLICSHHGHGRPWLTVAVDEFPPSVLAAIDGVPVTVSGDLSLPDWDQPRRFRALCERYGVWGLALLEAILRQADHLVSERVEVA